MGTSSKRKPTEIDAGKGASEHIWQWLAVGSGIAFVLLASHAAWVETPTIDEFAHVPAGCAYWSHGRFDLYAKNPPLWKMVMAAPVLVAGASVPAPGTDQGPWAPWLYGYEFLEANRDAYFRLFWWARMASVLVTLLGGGLLYVWTRQLFDERAAGISTALYLLNPNILAHGHLATIDSACATTVLATLLTFRRARAGNSWRMAVVGAAWGIALLTKFTALLLLPVLAALLLLHRWRKWRELVIESSLLLSMTWLTVNLGMGLDGSFSRLDGYHLVSQFGGQVQQALPGWLPVPLPRSYVLGFDQQKQDAEQSELFGSYLFGVWSTKGWWYYNLVALVVKNPLPIVAMVLIAPLLWRRLPVPRIAAAEVWAPLLTLLASMLLFNRLNIGVRYLLPIFPLALLVAAAAWQGRQKWQPWLAGGLLALHVATAALVHPDYLTYFNLAVGGPGNGHLVLLDSNLDWGQDLYRVPQALASMGHRGPVKLLYFGHVPPEMYGLQYELPGPEPAEGMFAVSLQYLMGGDYVALAPDGRSQPIPPGYIAWLRQFPPAAKAGTIWIFHVRSTRK